MVNTLFAGLLLGNSYVNMPPLPNPIQEIYPSAHGNGIVVAGGLRRDSDTGPLTIDSEVWWWNKGSDNWEPFPHLPAPRHHGMLVSVNDNLYLFGGFIDRNGQWFNTDSSLSLSAEGTSWYDVPSMPMPLSETVSAVHGNDIHFVTGRTPSSGKNGRWQDSIDTALHLIYTVDTQTWREGVSAPTARNSACSVMVNGQWHVIGGRTVKGGNLPTHEVYSFTSKAWTTLPPLPEARGGLACSQVDEIIYVFGGEFFDNGGGVYSTVFAYDTESNKWFDIGEMPVPKHGLGSVSLGGDIYLIGGAEQAGARNTSRQVERFRP